MTDRIFRMRAILLVSLSSLLDVAYAWSQTHQLIPTGDGSGWEGLARFWITISSEFSYMVVQWLSDICFSIGGLLSSALCTSWEHLSKRYPLNDLPVLHALSVLVTTPPTQVVTNIIWMDGRPSTKFKEVLVQTVLL